jgi:hypothetical protein
MSVGIRNVQELKSALKIPVQRSIEQLGKIVKEQVKYFVKTVVYDPFIPETYVRNKEDGGLLGSWINMDFDFKTVIFSDWESMEEHERGDPEDFVHGSEYYEIKDIRSWLVRYVNEGMSGNIFGEGYWTSHRNFWDPTIHIVETEILKKDIKTVFAKNKLIIV